MNLTIAERNKKRPRTCGWVDDAGNWRKGTQLRTQKKSAPRLHLLTFWLCDQYTERGGKKIEGELGGGGKTVRQKSSFGLVGVLNRSLVDRQIGKMQKSKQPKAKPVSRRRQGESGGRLFLWTDFLGGSCWKIRDAQHSFGSTFWFSSCASPRRRRRRRPLCDLYLQSEIFRAPSATSSVPSFTFRLKWEFRVRV